MTIAQEVYKECMKQKIPSNALEECGKEKERYQNWENETTTYIFEDDSKIIDCNGELSL